MAVQCMFWRKTCKGRFCISTTATSNEMCLPVTFERFPGLTAASPIDAHSSWKAVSGAYFMNYIHRKVWEDTLKPSSSRETLQTRNTHNIPQESSEFQTFAMKPHDITNATSFGRLSLLPEKEKNSHRLKRKWNSKGLKSWRWTTCR